MAKAGSSKSRSNPYSVGGKFTSLLPTHLRNMCRVDVEGGETYVSEDWHRHHIMWLKQMVKDKKLRAVPVVPILRILEKHSVDELTHMLRESRESVSRRTTDNKPCPYVNNFKRDRMSCKGCPIVNDLIRSLKVEAREPEDEADRNEYYRRKLGGE